MRCNMTKKEIQRLRKMKYFIDAAEEIIENEGIDKITIRKVADVAGYNSATLYNYFESLDHLLFYTYMRYLKDYAYRLQTDLKQDENAVDQFLSIWRLFASESMKHPSIFYTLFFTEFSNDFNHAVKEYYSIYPENLGTPPEEVMPMLMERNIYERDYRALELCAKKGFLRYEDLREINEIIMLMYQGILVRLKDQKDYFDPDEATEKLIKYINVVLNNYIIK